MGQLVFYIRPKLLPYREGEFFLLGHNTYKNPARYFPVWRRTLTSIEISKLAIQAEDHGIQFTAKLPLLTTFFLHKANFHCPIVYRLSQKFIACR